MASLHSTTLAVAISATDRTVPLVSSAAQSGGIPAVARGDILFIGTEGMTVIGFGTDGVTPRVMRGTGTTAHSHPIGSQVYSGPAWMFKNADPGGIPQGTPTVNPWINLRNGTVWIAQGDEAGPNVGARYWQLQTTSRSLGSLGIRTPAVLTP